MRSEIVACALAMGMLMTVSVFAQGPNTNPHRASQAASNPQLATEINRLFNADLKDAVPSDKVHARVRQIFVKQGVPTNEMVGKETTEEYVVLLSGEPLSFVRTVLPRVRRAADAGTNRHAKHLGSTRTQKSNAPVLPVPSRGRARQYGSCALEK
jgi:hypothetical protein